MFVIKQQENYRDVQLINMYFKGGFYDQHANLNENTILKSISFYEVKKKTKYMNFTLFELNIGYILNKSY